MTKDAPLAVWLRELVSNDLYMQSDGLHSGLHTLSSHWLSLDEATTQTAVDMISHGFIVLILKMFDLWRTTGHKSYR